ncbi:MAG: hypothetical protein IKP46_02490 [Bacteroidales bacterium]|nr:hypothetical protein [Bacteroidales bacterium]
MDSTEKKIERMVREGGEGKVWFPSDFFECGSEKAVSKALQRLVADEVLMRMVRGLYCFPTVDRMWGMGKLPASSDEVIKAFAEKDGFKIGPCPGEAQNALGLSEQVVMNPVFTTDGPSRRIPYAKGARPIVLYHVPPRVFNYKSRIVMLAVIALNDIGKEHLWEYDLDRMKSIFGEVPYSEIRDDLRITPSWIRNIILGFYESDGKNN